MILTHRSYCFRRPGCGFAAVAFAVDDQPATGGGAAAEDADDPAADDPGVQAGEATSSCDPSAAGERDWKTEYVREAAQSRKYRQRAQKAESELEQLRPRVLGEQEHLEFQRLRQRADELAQRDQQIARLQDMVRQVSGLSELNKALAACGVGRGCPHADKMLAQAATLLAGRIDVEMSGPMPAVRVLDEAGAVLAAPDGTPVSVRQFVADWLASEGIHFLPPSGDTGSGAFSGYAPPPSVDIQALDRDVRAKAEFIARHGPAAYLQLAQRRRQ